MSVATVPFFGPGGALQAAEGASFVKLDAEGAEMQILADPDDASAAEASAWMGVTRLVFEWSFTKDRRMATFRRAVGRLCEAGFDVMYDWQGSCWESLAEWPWHTDALVFASRRL